MLCLWGLIGTDKPCLIQFGMLGSDLVKFLSTPALLGQAHTGRDWQDCENQKIVKFNNLWL